MLVVVKRLERFEFKLTVKIKVSRSGVQVPTMTSEPTKPRRNRASEEARKRDEGGLVMYNISL